jgi:UDP-N-acetylglucosamine transferase subunit ALG13
MNKNSSLEELKTLRGAIVVSTGGHLEQAIRRARQLELDSVVYFVPKTAQSESKLSNENSAYIRNVGSRDILGFLIATIQLTRKLNRGKFDYVLSTGAGVALSCLIVCKLKKIQFYYIESVARITAPSFTGKILSFTKSAALYSESSSFDSRKWMPVSTLFSAYKRVSGNSRKQTNANLKIFVTVGTVHKFKFDRIVEMVRTVLTDSDQVVWQIGDVKDFESTANHYRELTNQEIVDKINWADVVITHSGVGSLLTILDNGKYPIIVPRLSKFGEHIDDHQFQIASKISKLGLGIVVQGSLNREILQEAVVNHVELKVD